MFIHFLINGHLGYSTVMNKDTPDILFSLFCGYMFSCLFGKYLRLEMLAHRIGVLMFNFIKNCQFSEVVEPFYSPIGMCDSFQFFILWPTFSAASFFLNFGHSSWHGMLSMVSHCSFKMHCPKDEHVEHLFFCTVVI